MKALMALIVALAVPLQVLNLIGGVVSGVWLAILGEWGAVGIGVLFFIASVALLDVALMPCLLIAAVVMHFAEKRKAFWYILFAVLNLAYFLGLVTAWCSIILFVFLKDATEATLIPRLIWSYGVATGPWLAIAAREDRASGGNFNYMMPLFLAQLAYVVIILLVVFSPITFPGAVKVLGGVMAVGFLYQFAFAVTVYREESV